MGRSDDHVPTTYEIRLAGHLDGRWAARFEGLDMRRVADGTTVLSGPIVDQAALHGLLQRVRDLGVPLVSVTRPEPQDSPSPEADTSDRPRPDGRDRRDDQRPLTRPAIPERSHR